MSVFDINNIPEQIEEIVDKPLIMLIDDEIENLNVLSRLLSEDYQIVTCLSGSDALCHINNMADPKAIQLIVSDQRMPKMSGVEFFEQILTLMPDTIRIILTGYSDTQAIIDSVNRAKLYKFMTKPFNPAELSLMVQRGIEVYDMKQQILEYTQSLEQKIKERTEELEQKNEILNETLAQLEKISLTDQLTGAHNRRFVSKFFPNELSQLQREHFKPQSGIIPGNLALISIDADHFKQINDTYGHDAGDRVLIQLVEVLNKTCRGGDWVVRWGGEEFLVIAKFQHRDEIHHLAERIRTNIANHTFELGNGHQINRTCSMGIAAVPFIKKQYDALSWEQTLNLADMALYNAKNNGRNSWFSLFESNTTDASSCYQLALDDLSGQIKQGSLACASSQ